MCIQFRSYLRGARFTLRTDHKSLVWLHHFKDTEGMMSRWLHTLQQFQFSSVHRPGKDHGNADGLSHAPTSPCRQCTGRPASRRCGPTIRPVARKMTIWCRSSREKTGLLNSTMTCYNQPPFLETHSASRLSSARTLCVSHCIHGLLLASFHHGLRLRACFWNSVRCGITATIYRLTTMAQEKFTEPTSTAIGPQGRSRTAILVLPCFLIWWPSGQDPNPSSTITSFYGL